MNCTEIDNGFAVYTAFLQNEDEKPVNKLNEKVGSCARFLPKKAHSSKTRNVYLVANRRENSDNDRSKNAPYSREEIDKMREDSREAKQEANHHIRESWTELLDQHPGRCIGHSIDGIKSLIESEKLEREAIRMENENVDYYQNGRK